MSQTINPAMSIANQERRLREAMDDMSLKVNRNRYFRRKFFVESHLWQAMSAGQNVGESFTATHKEVKAMSAEAEKTFTKALKRWKPGSKVERPRLTTYELVVEKPTAPEKNLWEP